MRLAPIMQAFFTDYLMTQRHASRHTIASYRDCLRLLLTFARQRTGKLPAQLDLADLDAVLIGTFLTELESTVNASRKLTPCGSGKIDPGGLVQSRSARFSLASSSRRWRVR